MTIIGVVADIHHQGLQKTIDPKIFLLKENASDFYSIKMQSANLQQTITGIKIIWDKYFPNDPFNYFFLDEFYDKQYRSETIFGTVIALFALINNSGAYNMVG